MDIATGVGLLFGVVVLCTLILMGGDFRMFYDIHAVIIIFGGSFAATLIRFPLSAIVHGLPLGAKFAFTLSRSTPAISSTKSRASPRSPASRARSVSKRSRPTIRSSPRAFATSRTATTSISFATISNAIATTSSCISTKAQKIYRAIGDCAPAFGMIGTLLGMVQMFSNMSDPSKLGPFMAVALLATLYGAVVANLFCLPIADKLHVKVLDEETNRTLIIDGILMIRDSKSPALVREMLLAYLPEKHRHDRRRAGRRPNSPSGRRGIALWRRKRKRKSTAVTAGS